MFKYNLHKSQKGFTLLELLTGVSIFSITILSMVAIFNKVIISQKKAIISQSIQNNIRFALEFMNKEIRMAQKSPADKCANNKVYDFTNGILTFENKNGECIKYSKINDQLYRSVDDVALPMTSEELKISNLNFYIDNTNQPIITYTMKLESKNGRKINLSPINIQSTLTSRYYE